MTEHTFILVKTKGDELDCDVCVFYWDGECNEPGCMDCREQAGGFHWEEKDE